MTYKAEVIADSSGKWVGNGLTFDTRAEAETYVHDLMYRWTSVRETRVVEVAPEESWENSVTEADEVEEATQ